MNDIRSSVYAQKVELLLRLIPIVMDEEVFAIHGAPLHIKRATVNQWLAFSFFRVSSYRVSSVLEPADTPSGSPEPSQFFTSPSFFS